jgi:hypothetical protein
LKALLKNGAFLFEQTARPSLSAARKTLPGVVLRVNFAGFIDVK